MGGVSYSAGAVVRVVLTVPGLWWAGAMGPDTHLLSSSFRFFPPGVRRVLSSYTPLGSIGLTHGSIGLTRWSIGLTVLSGSTPGAWVISPKFCPRTCCRAHRARFAVAIYLLTTFVCHGCELHECVAANSMGLFNRAWCKKRTFHCPGKYDAKKATILSHLRIFGEGRVHSSWV